MTPRNLRPCLQHPNKSAVHVRLSLVPSSVAKYDSSIHAEFSSLPSKASARHSDVNQPNNNTIKQTIFGTNTARAKSREYNTAYEIDQSKLTQF